MDTAELDRMLLDRIQELEQQVFIYLYFFLKF